MGVVIAVLGGLAQIAIPIAVIVFFVRRRRGGNASVDLGLVVRRLFEYGFLYGLLWIAGVGVAGLLSELFEVLEGAAADDTGEVALWWTFTLVGGAGLVGHSAMLHRRFIRGPDETAVTFWWAYLSVVDLTALGAGIVASVLTLSWPIAGHTFNAGAPAVLIVATTAWVVHWRLAGRPVAVGPARNQVHLLVGSLVGMVGLGISFVLALSQLLGWFYDGVTPGLRPDVDGWVPVDATFDEVADALPSLLTFGLVWWWYWWRNARSTGHSVQRHTYVLVVGVLGALASAVAAASALLFLSLSWLLVDQHGMSATEHFEPLPEMVALFLAGTALWAYHRRELQPVRVRTEVERSYDYLSAWVGLVASTVGLYVLLEGVVLSRVLSGSGGGGGEADSLVLLLVLLSVGGTVWWRAWSRTRSHAEDRSELASPARRIYLFVVFGSTALAVLVGLLFLVFNVVYGLLERDLSAERVADMGVPLAVIGSTVGVAAYHRRFLRQIRALRPGEQAPQARTGVIETYGLSHISLSVNDPEVSLVFYAALFGVREHFRDENYIQALGPGEHDVLAFERRDDHGLSGGINHFGFRLTSPDGIESVIEKAKAVGATILRHGERRSGEPYMYIADPDGYEIEIWYEPHPGGDPLLGNTNPPVGSD